MQRKAILLITIILSLSLLLSACGQKSAAAVSVIGEDEAKQAGLALINQAFGVEETEALAQYQELPGEPKPDNGVPHYGGRESKRVYLLMVASKEAGEESYTAKVDAVTGIAFYAERNMSYIELTAEQQKQAESLGTPETYNPNALIPAQQDAEQLVNEYMKPLLGKEDSVLRVFPDMIETDSVDFPKVRLEYFVLTESGRIYHIELCWPTMELIFVEIRD